MTVKIETRWFVGFGDEFFHRQIYGCNSEREARQKARELRGVKKLPSGTKVYSKTEEVKYAI